MKWAERMKILSKSQLIIVIILAILFVLALFYVSKKDGVGEDEPGESASIDLVKEGGTKIICVGDLVVEEDTGKILTDCSRRGNPPCICVGGW